MTRPDVWLIDLDDTLYAEDTGVFLDVRKRIRAYIREFLHLDEDAATELQRRLRDRYGTSLNGLMAEYQIEADHFLDYVHDVDLSPLRPAPDMAAALTRLPGRKIIFTNADYRHAGRVLARLEIDAALFEAIYDIRAANFTPKPRVETYQRLCALHRVAPQDAIMIDDRLENLETAANLGMRTAWSRPKRLADQALPDYVHHDAPDVLSFLMRFGETP